MALMTPEQLAACTAPPVYPEQGPTSPYDVLCSVTRLRGIEYVAGDTVLLDDDEAARLLAVNAVGAPGAWVELLAARAEQAALNELGYHRAGAYAANHARNKEAAERVQRH